jgi:hypothetical protein
MATAKLPPEIREPEQLLSRERAGQRGSILILVALTMTMLLGVAALSIDASYMYDKRNRLYAAADAAAKAGAIEVLRNSGVTPASLKTFADHQVALHGFTTGVCGTTSATSVCVNHPPASGPFAGDAGYVEAIVSERTSTFFGGVVGFANLTPGARAVAGTSAPSNCLILIGAATGSPTALEIGNTSLAMTGCGVAVGGPAGTADLSGANPNAAITGTPPPPVSVTGTCTGTCSGMGTLTAGAPSPVDPLAGLTGNNVMLYLTGAGQLTSLNNNELHLTAAASGTYAGIAIFQDPSDGANFVLGNNFDMDITGVIYMPGVDVDINNSILFVNTTCKLFVARTLNIRNGNGSFTNAGCAGLYAGGGAAFLSVSLAE